MAAVNESNQATQAAGEVTRHLRIRLVKSPIGYSERQRRTARALGLRRINQIVEQADSPAVRGMIAKIPHLLNVESVEATPEVKQDETA